MQKLILVVLFLATLSLSVSSLIAYTGLFHYFFLDNKEGAIGASMIMIGTIPWVIVYGLIIGFKRSLLAHKLVKLSTIPFVLILVNDIIVIISQLVVMYT
tara:strand:- start:44 stop:343 length:300 start_codon:yes stop_codon:yes gene_type:complete